MGGNGNGDQIDLNIFDRLKDRHRNLILNNLNNNNKQQLATSNKRYLKQCEFFSEKKAEASQIDVSRALFFTKKKDAINFNFTI